MAGIKITLRDPNDVTNLIHAEFATARSHPELLGLLRNIASADVANSIAERKHEIAQDALYAATTPENADEAGKNLSAAMNAVTDASQALFDALLAFVVAGYTLAGAPTELAETLTDSTPLEQLPELKAKCLLGSGTVDFTTGAGQ